MGPERIRIKEPPSAAIGCGDAVARSAHHSRVVILVLKQAKLATVIGQSSTAFRVPPPKSCDESGSITLEQGLEQFPDSFHQSFLLGTERPRHPECDLTLAINNDMRGPDVDTVVPRQRTALGYDLKMEGMRPYVR